ncbi:MAG: ribonuclease Z [Ruminococcus flavefaciens]|nr:ribonuclease Z [Ruminococcus flavefaciens]
MARFSINILGCGSATPSLRHLPACQVVDFRDNLMMIDCGEGAQLSMRRMKLKFTRLNHIFISHMHGDHVLGLPGLLSTLALQGKTGTFTVHVLPDGVKILQDIVNFFCREPGFEIIFNPVDPRGGIVYEDHALTVEAFPLYHRVPCVGYRFVEKPKPRHLIGDMVKFHHVPIAILNDIKQGADFVTPDGRVIPNSYLTTDADPSVSYAYCSDTLYDSRVAEAIKGTDTVYHEATYIDADIAKAHARGHATASEAARIALEAGAKQLILGHYSKCYDNEDEHLAEARAIFPNTILANEGLAINLL